MSRLDGIRAGDTIWQVEGGQYSRARVTAYTVLCRTPSKFDAAPGKCETRPKLGSYPMKIANDRGWFTTAAEAYAALVKMAETRAAQAHRDAAVADSALDDARTALASCGS
jgi:hypothetical protein